MDLADLAVWFLGWSKGLHSKTHAHGQRVARGNCFLGYLVVNAASVFSEGEPDSGFSLSESSPIFSFPSSLSTNISSKKSFLKVLLY